MAASRDVDCFLRLIDRSDTKLQIKMLCLVSFRPSGLKKAVVAEDFLSLVRKGGIFSMIFYRY